MDTKWGWVLCFVVGVESMLVTSSLFHRVRWSPAHRRAMKRADHSAIFLAITGSYLAIAGLTTHGTIRLVLLIIVVAGALVGVAIRQLALDTPKWVNTSPYLCRVGRRRRPASDLSGGGALCFSLSRAEVSPTHWVPHLRPPAGRGSLRVSLATTSSFTRRPSWAWASTSLRSRWHCASWAPR